MFDRDAGTRALSMVEAALNIIAEHDARRMNRIARDLRWIWIQRTGYGVGYYVHESRACVLDREYLLLPDTSPAIVAAWIVHEATHARLETRNIRYHEPARARIEAVCYAQALEFARRVPDGDSLARNIQAMVPTDEATWSSKELARRRSDSKRIEYEALAKDIDSADLPEWLKRWLLRVARSRAA